MNRAVDMPVKARLQSQLQLRRTVLVLFAVALAFYFGFILMTVMQPA